VDGCWEHKEPQMDVLTTLDDIDRHVAAVFDTNVPVMRYVRLTCGCGRFSILPMTEPGPDEERTWTCPICAMDDAGLDLALAKREADRRQAGG
jgi:hypothetical protein